MTPSASREDMGGVWGEESQALCRARSKDPPQLINPSIPQSAAVWHPDFQGEELTLGSRMGTQGSRGGEGRGWGESGKEKQIQENACLVGLTSVRSV